MVMNVTFGAVSVISVCMDVHAQLLAAACLAGKLTFHNIVRFPTDGAVAARANFKQKKIVRYDSCVLFVPQFLMKCE
jgi:hypothetical protein